MKQKLFYHFLLAAIVAFAGSSMIACTEDTESLPSSCNEFITFDKPEIAEVSSSFTRAVEGVNRNNSVLIGSKILRSKKNGVMHLNVLENNFFAQRGTTEEKAATRGTLVTSGAGITNFGVSSSAYPASGTYTSYGLGSYFYKQQAVPNTSMAYYWPTADKEISFFAYYPYNNASFTVSSSAVTLGSPIYHYTVPSTISNQVDVMTSQVIDHTAGSQGALTLNFSHHCAAIKISITNNSGSSITVNSVSIEGVEYDGTLHDGTWTLSGNKNSSSANPFSLSYGSAIVDGATADITGVSNIFIMLPQTLTSSAKLKLVTTEDTYETSISGSWEAGKTYTYDLTLSETGFYTKRYLTFEAMESGTFTLTIGANVPTSLLQSVSYSTDNGSTWTTTNNIDATTVTITTPTIAAGSKVLWKGTGTAMSVATSSTAASQRATASSVFSSTGNFNVEGNIMSLLYGDDFKDKTSFASGSSSNFACLFYSNNMPNPAKVVSIEKLVLPATAVTNFAYINMFHGCSNLTTTPTELPATTLAQYCYNYMFYGCTGLTSAPELPATTLANYCYQSMFNGCNALTTAPELPATTLAQNCYSEMFGGCTSLTTAPELPATIDRKSVV